MSFKLKWIFWLTSIVIVSSSCDAIYDYRYHFDNQTSGEMSVHMAGLEFDTILVIPFAEKRSFLIPESFVEGANGPHEHPVSSDFDQLMIMNQDSILSQRDYLNNDQWEFVKSDAGKFFTVVTNDEF